MDSPRGRGRSVASGGGEAPPPKRRGLKQGRVAKNRSAVLGEAGAEVSPEMVGALSQLGQ